MAALLTNLKDLAEALAHAAGGLQRGGENRVVVVEGQGGVLVGLLRVARAACRAGLGAEVAGPQCVHHAKLDVRQVARAGKIGDVKVRDGVAGLGLVLGDDARSVDGAQKLVETAAADTMH